MLAALGWAAAARFTTPPAAAEGAGLVRWRAPAEAAAESKRLGRPILYDFTAGWCPPCKRMTTEVFGNPADAAMINSRFVPVRVMDRKSEDGKNPPDIEALQRTYHIDAFPTLVVEFGDGRKPLVFRGYASAANTRQDLERAAGTAR